MYSMGIDYGTNSVRCVVLNLESGIETGEDVSAYPSGDGGILTNGKNPYLARQNPADYHISLEKAVAGTLKKAGKDKHFSPEKIVGIGIDTTGSTPLPVDKKLVPLSFHDRFKNNENAMAYLWKDHTASDEAEEITRLAAKIRPRYLSRIGGIYSSEWFFSKLLYLARRDKEVFTSMETFMELCDYMPAVLSGITNPSDAVRSVCAAGHKAMYSDDWGGLPDENFLGKLDNSLRHVRAKLYSRAYPAGETAGYLSGKWAKRLGLPRGIPISAGAFDAHMGAVGAGVRPGVLVKVIGTSTCDMTVSPEPEAIKDIPGICGIVPGSIIPGLAGIEAGQSAVGDIFHWFVSSFMKGSGKDHGWLSSAAAKTRPGETGLIALDWQNGNRSILVDQKLTGLVLGFTLQTRPEEVYKALIEATGFGARTIIERMEEYGVEIKEIVATGGIPEKNPLLMQTYADITGRKLKIADSSQTCAVGAAMFGAVSAGREGKEGFTDILQAQKKICRFKRREYRPDVRNKKIYDRLYAMYKDLHDSFGTLKKDRNLHHVMKSLIKIQAGAKNG